MMDWGRLDGFYASDLFIDNFVKEGVVNGKINANWRQRLGNRIKIKTISTVLRVATQLEHNGLQEKFVKPLYLVLQKKFTKEYMNPMRSNLRGALISDHLRYSGALTPRLSPQA